MKKKVWLAAGALGLAMFASVPALSAAPSATAFIIGAVNIDPSDPSVAHVTARYVCQDGNEPQWLWVSAKQVASGLPDRRLQEEGSSQISSGWLQSHPLGQFTCDGTWRIQTFEINTEFDEANGGGHGTLRRGTVWVQFCLFDGEGNFINSYRWALAR